MSLFREFKIKWWDKFNQALCSDITVTEFITTGKKLQYQIQQVPKKVDSPVTPKTTHKTPTTVQEDSDSEDEFQQFLKFQKFKKMQKQLNRSRASSTTSSSSDPIGGQDPFDM